MVDKVRFSGFNDFADLIMKNNYNGVESKVFFDSNVVVIPVDGDVQVVGGLIYVYCDGDVKLVIDSGRICAVLSE